MIMYGTQRVTKLPADKDFESMVSMFQSETNTLEKYMYVKLSKFRDIITPGSFMTRKM